MIWLYIALILGLKKFQQRNNKNIILVITADDITGGNDNNVFNQMQVIGFTDGEIIKVNSENKLYLTGEKSKSYGKEDLFYAIRKVLARWSGEYNKRDRKVNIRNYFIYWLSISFLLRMVNI